MLSLLSWKKFWSSPADPNRLANELSGAPVSARPLGIVVLSGVSAILLQTSLFPHSPFVPDFVLILCVYIGIYHRSVGGAAAAFFLGYILDTCSGAPVGMHACAMSTVFAAVAAISGSLWLNNPLAVLGLILLAVGLKTAVFLVFSTFGQLATVLQPVIARYVMWDAAVAMLLTPIVFIVLRRREPESG